MDSKLNDLQKVCLEILGAVTEVCDRHGLRYYALGGTLLGAVRHKGFIPWDDDIDIGLSRPDYDRLLEACHGELAEDYVVQDYMTLPDDPALHHDSRASWRWVCCRLCAFCGGEL